MFIIAIISAYEADRFLLLKIYQVGEFNKWSICGVLTFVVVVLSVTFYLISHTIILYLTKNSNRDLKNPFIWLNRFFLTFSITAIFVIPILFLVDSDFAFWIMK